jgi:hypothetical protein
MPNPLVFVALIPIWAACMLCFDRLVRREYDAYPQQWEQDGRPRGIFWAPPEAARQAAPFFAWLFATPAWAQTDPSAHRLLWALRLLTLAWNVGVIGLIVVPIVLAM